VHIEGVSNRANEAQRAAKRYDLGQVMIESL
jgi:hypothetical protein